MFGTALSVWSCRRVYTRNGQFLPSVVHVVPGWLNNIFTNRLFSILPKRSAAKRRIVLSSSALWGSVRGEHLGVEY